MHVISRKRLREAAAIYADLEGPLDTWFRIAKKAKWNNLAEIRQTFPSTDAVEGYTVFNIKGNEYRLITRINYRTGRVFIREVLTHGEYDRGSWKK
jgi:mRNA interferase HigB